MTRKVILTTLKVLGIKKSFAAKVIGVQDNTFSSKLKSYRNTAYRLFDDEIALLIAKVMDEKISTSKEDDYLQRIKKVVKTKELADAIYEVTKSNLFFVNDKNYYFNYSNENYYEFIISTIWLEQSLCNKYHDFISQNSYQNSDPKVIYDLFEKTFILFKKGRINL